KDAKILTDVYLALRGHTQMGFNLLNNNDTNQFDKIEPYDKAIHLTKEETDDHKEFIKMLEIQTLK
ncbi:hypothetical protein OAQ08_04540, partial [Alphaproteobacteria bacterium]|nr:hypothetical protein [Alphaproteobacteria bacterium]